MSAEAASRATPTRSFMMRGTGMDMRQINAWRIWRRSPRKKTPPPFGNRAIVRSGLTWANKLTLSDAAYVGASASEVPTIACKSSDGTVI